MEEDWYTEDIYKVSNPAIKRCEPSDFGDDE